MLAHLLVPIPLLVMVGEPWAAVLLGPLPFLTGVFVAWVLDTRPRLGCAWLAGIAVAAWIVAAAMCSLELLSVAIVIVGSRNWVFYRKMLSHFRRFFSAKCAKPAAAAAIEPWTLQELHHRFYGNQSVALYEERDTDVPPLPGDEVYHVHFTVAGTTVLLPEWKDNAKDLTCTHCIVGLHVRGPNVQKASLLVGRSIVDTMYGKDGVFNPTVLPLLPLHRIDVVVDEGRGPFEVSYSVRKIQNPRVDYKYWFTTEQRMTILLHENERTRRTLWFNHPISRLQIKTSAIIEDVRLIINERPYEGEFDKDGICAFEPLTLDFSAIDFAALEITTRGPGARAEIIATDCQLAIVDKGMFMRKYGA